MDSRAPKLSVVIPVYNEEHVLEASVRRLHRHLSASFPFEWRILIADNASTDGTRDLALRLAPHEGHHASGVPGLTLIRADQPGQRLPALYEPGLVLVLRVLRGPDGPPLLDTLRRLTPGQAAQDSILNRLGVAGG